MSAEQLRPQRAKSTKPTPPPIEFCQAIFRARAAGRCCSDSASGEWRVCVCISSGQDGGRHGDARPLRPSRIAPYRRLPCRLSRRALEQQTPLRLTLSCWVRSRKALSRRPSLQQAHWHSDASLDSQAYASVQNPSQQMKIDTLPASWCGRLGSWSGLVAGHGKISL